MRHNIIGSPGCTVMPELLDPRDFVVDTKKRYDCFLGTDLDFLLRSHGVNTLLITGVNTNSCVLATTTAANVRDYAVIVVEDCVDTMDGSGAARSRSRLHQDGIRLRDGHRRGDGARRACSAPEQRCMTAQIPNRLKSDLP